MHTVTNPTETASEAIKRCPDLHGGGHYSESITLARECLAHAGDDSNLCWRCHTAIGNACRMMELFAESLEAHKTALSIARDAGNDRYVAMAWTNLGTTFLCASNWDLAIECFSKVTADRKLRRALAPYTARGNLAICHLHLENISEGLRQARKAFLLETPELIESNPHSPILFRHTFVQLAIMGGRCRRDEVEARAREGIDLAGRFTQPRNCILAAVLAANLQVRYGDCEQAIAALKKQLPAARECPQVLFDVLYALVHAEGVAGRPANAAAYLSEWAQHLFPEGPQMARQIGINFSWLEPGETIREQLERLAQPHRVPPVFETLLERH